jgi:lysozyme family protein
MGAFAQMNRDQGIALMLRVEGGEANLKGDPGGHTKYGITQRTLDAVRAIMTDAEDPIWPASVGDLTIEQATAIYRKVQWVHIRGNDLDPALAVLLLNAAVNMGEPRAIMLLQEALGVSADGVFGTGTLAAVHTWHSPYMPDQTLAQEYAARAARRYAQLNATEGQFELDWFRRLFLVYTLATASQI